jgi:predicted permease
MNWLKQLFSRRRLYNDLSNEMQQHLEEKVEELIATGLSKKEATAAARRAFGNVTLIEDDSRAVWQWRSLESFFADIRYALRTLSKSPGFSCVAVLTLALGIGANTAIFTLLDAVLLSKLPVSQQQELVLFSDDPREGNFTGTEAGHWYVFSYPDYLHFRERNESFQDLCAFQEGRNRVRVHVAGTKAVSSMESARGKLVSGNYFQLLGVGASVGRTLAADDDRAEASPAAVLNYGYWKRRFHSDPSVVDKVLEVNDVPVTIVGVAPSEFFGESATSIPDFWLPISMQPRVMQRSSFLDDTSTHWLNIMGRLKAGVRREQAQTVVSVQLRQMLTARAGSQLSADTQQDIDRSYVQLTPGDIGISALRVRYSQPLHILMAVVGLILLIACANVANLLLSHAAAREKEISLRLALGASRGRLTRQLLTESVLLALLGGVLGILFAQWGAKILLFRVAGNGTPLHASPNVSVLVFTAAVSVLAGILFGIFPALRASRAELNSMMKGAASAARVAGLRLGLANGLVIFQIAASLVLIISAGLFLRTLKNLMEQELGFDEGHVLIVGMDPRAAGYTPDQMNSLNRLLLERLEVVPGVRSVSYEYTSPLSGSESSGPISVEGMPPRPHKEMGLHRNAVGPHYFETMGIPILLGRGIETRDTEDNPRIAVVNQAMVEKFLAGVNPIGKRFSEGGPDFDGKDTFEIVGVSADARFYSLREQIPPMAFVSAPQLTGSDYAFVRDIDIRAAGDPRTVETEVRRVIGEAAPGLPVTSVKPLREQVSGQVEQERTIAGLSSTFGGLALLLACLGLYGTMSYRVSRRTGEIGVRMALGAQRRNVLWMVMRECLFLLTVGLCAGGPLALTVTRLISNQLFNLSPMDPPTVVLATFFLAAVGAIAGFVAARRGMRVDPIVALRYE